MQKVPGIVSLKIHTARVCLQVREALMATGVAQGVLRCIWELSDIDKDGQLDMDEFAVAMYLCRQAQRGQPMPQALPSQVHTCDLLFSLS